MEFTANTITVPAEEWTVVENALFMAEAEARRFGHHGIASALDSHLLSLRPNKWGERVVRDEERGVDEQEGAPLYMSLPALRLLDVLHHYVETTPAPLQGLERLNFAEHWRRRVRRDLLPEAERMTKQLNLEIGQVSPQVSSFAQWLGGIWPKDFIQADHGSQDS